ncbi:MAG: aminotransferase class I/II-fold pyridoxal phosphate-dependent enzyme, partial [Methylophilaceae bacterium]|nr:aminotransferase class I/II-fold pyridoxal phosphate-dependent enzyme [Methylophilaceae bacterium]
LLIGDSARALALSAALQKKGILVPAIRPPSVPKGSARLRISLSAAHKMQDIECLVSALESLKDLL